MQKIRYFERIFCVYALELRTKITLGVLALPQCGSCQRQVLRSKTAGFSTFALQKPDLRSVRAFLRGAYTPSGKVCSVGCDRRCKLIFVRSERFFWTPPIHAHFICRVFLQPFLLQTKTPGIAGGYVAFICFSLRGLLADISKDTAVYVKDMSVYCV